MKTIHTHWTPMEKALVAGLVIMALIMITGITSPAVQAASVQNPYYRQVAVIHIPAPNNLLFGDIIYGDTATGYVYFSDISNSAVDVINARSDKLVTQITGFTNGPGGVLADDLGQLWAANGNGTVKVANAIYPFKITDTVSTGSSSADEMAYDPRDRIIAVTSPDAAQPFVTLIAARPNKAGHHQVLGQVAIPGVGQGSIEQPQWDPINDTFFESVRTSQSFPNGEVVVIDPKAIRLRNVLPLSEKCNPGGTAIGPDDQALLGCNTGGPLIINRTTGAIVDRYQHMGACCADEVWYNPSDGRYYAAEAGAVGPPPNPQLAPPAVMVINAETHNFITNIELGKKAIGFHQVTAIYAPAKVFIPEPNGMHVFMAV